MNSNKTLAIIPCAGYGTRIGMSIDKSKELLINPETNKPLIQWHLDLCALYDLQPLVVTRKEKTDLIDYCVGKGVELLIIEPNGEWPNTVLKSSHLWKENNILLLPDTTFKPDAAVYQLKESLEVMGCYSALGVHQVDDPQKWGIVNDYYLYEKPTKFSGKQWAWGIMGWKRHEGEKILRGLIDNKIYLLYNSSMFFLEDFKDVTREKK